MSLFTLKTDTSDLQSANEGISNERLHQHGSTRDIANGAFSQGSIHYRWETSGTNWWVPNRSYLRLRCKLTKGDGTTPLTVSDNIAPAMNMASHLFQSMELRMNDTVISRLSDFVPACDTISNRLLKSDSWLSTVGKSSNFWDASFQARQADVCSDGIVSSTEKNTYTTVDRVTLGYDAPGADNNSITIGSDGVNILPGANASPLPVGLWRKGDKIQIDSVGGEIYEILSVEADTPTGLSLTVSGGPTVEVADSNGDWARIRQDVDIDDARRAGDIELVFQPPLGIFKVSHAIPPGARFELVLTPQSSSTYQERVIESIGSNKTAQGLTPDFKFSVDSMYFYSYQMDGPRADSLTYLLDLDNISCNTETVSGTNFHSKHFDVPASCYATTVCYQDSRIGDSTQISASMFKCHNNALTDNKDELKLIRYYSNYAGVNKPQPDADPDFQTGRDYTVQRYMDSQLESGAYMDTGGTEDIQTFHRRGQYFHQRWSKDGNDASTRFSVNQQFESSANTDQMRLLLFSHSRSVARVSVENGRVVNVQVEES